MPEQLTEQQENALHRLYYIDMYQKGIHSTYKRVNEVNPNLYISRPQVEKWLKKQNTYQINLQQHRTHHIKPILSKKPFNILQADLIDFTQKPSGQYKYILVVIDVFSRYVFAKKLTNNTTIKTAKALKEILNEVERKRESNDALGNVRIVMTDNGSEFTNDFTEELKNRQIKQITGLPRTPQTQGVVERVNRTLKTALERKVQQDKLNREELEPPRDGRKWTYFLQTTLNEYNSNYHTVIQTKPENVLNYNQAQMTELRKRLEQKGELEEHKRYTAVSTSTFEPLEADDYVRVKRPKSKLEKSFTDNWSEQVYVVVRKVRSRNPSEQPRYKIKDLSGNIQTKARLRNDLQKVDPQE